MSLEPALEDLTATIHAYRSSRVLLTAVELGIFTALADGKRSSRDVAGELGLHVKGADRLMNALVAMGYLRKQDEHFLNTATTDRYLVRSRPDYLAGIAHSNQLWEYWSHLTEAVRDGTVTSRTDLAERGDSWAEPFIAAMHHRARAQAPGDVNLIDLHDVERVLDVGGGSAAYSMAMIAVKRDLHATVFDLPGVIPLTRRYIEEAGLAHRIATVAGDYHQDELPGGFDIVFLSAIVHSNARDENRRLIRKCAASLNPGGKVIVQDFIIDEDRVHPTNAALFALNMLVATEAGDTYTEAEVRSWMEEAGLTDVRREDTPSGSTQITGAGS
ncbi:MAG: methyltransferase domain-containing protein [Bacteroidetes bacterium]|nr:methyltransferase domain-containing protein [Bacteroidota bacterium]